MSRSNAACNIRTCCARDAEHEPLWPHSSAAFMRNQLACLALKNGYELICAHIPFIFCAVFGRQASFRRLLRQCLNTDFELWIRPETQDLLCFFPWNNLQHRPDASTERRIFRSAYHGLSLPPSDRLAKEKPRHAQPFNRLCFAIIQFAR